MAKTDLAATMLFYRRLVLSFCFPSGEEEAVPQRAAPNQKARKRAGKRTYEVKEIES